MTTKRVEAEVRFSTFDQGPKIAKIYDKITVDDMVRFIVDQEIYRLLSGSTDNTPVSREFKDFLVKEKYSVRKATS